ncbi:LacI family DNA-binding transcriptional regulator [Devosia sp. FJ2-5-3]|jgi:DNA-binding LacI/PurR family transcriptional regulator|uniref:LacI family DNA-binding transcriptional regulator n=1 Tax=Devosia sp. FJ2-5-3 TaxID=2976680 RepID=UPI0023D7F2B2|nr:LacI family DNA-binding transcriptional regulator [Devosia sp. FJ2-5-3]WEJ59628.1 LacI family DNA-binding transcriptional regulator [Devosia sp. FJ2-5-3]
MAEKELVRLRDVAREAGVSQGTASNVFNRPEVVREEVRERVLKAAGKLGYGGPSVAGRLLRAGRVNAVGVAAIEPLSYFFEDLWARHLLAEISEICDAQGAGVALVSAQSDERLDWNIGSAVVDGFILLCVEGGERLVEITRARRLPFVALAIGAADQTIPAIGVDNVGGARLAAEHLIGLGHRRLAILSTQLDDDLVGPASEAQMRAAKYSTSRDRAFGYWQAMEAAGIDIASVPIMVTQEDAGSTQESMAALFGSGERPSAILAMSDKIAMWAVDWLIRNGLSVPGDVSVVGFDGVPESAVATPKLTTVQQPMKDIARLAVEAALGGEQVEGRRILPAALVVRETTAPPRQ